MVQGREDSPYNTTLHYKQNPKHRYLERWHGFDLLTGKPIAILDTAISYEPEMTGYNLEKRSHSG